MNAWHSMEVVLVVMMAALAIGDDAQQVPPRTEAGQTLVVPAEHLELGEVYHVTPGAGTQCIITADAPLMRNTVVSSRLVGYLVAPFDIEEGQPPVVAGAWRIPLVSVKSGSSSYDQQFHGQDGFNTSEYPELAFRITGVGNVETLEAEQSRPQWKLTLSGELRCKDKSLTLELPTRLTLVPFTWATMPINLGDFFVLRTAFDVKTADLGIAEPPRRDPAFQGDSLHFDWMLLCSTAHPEKNLDPKTAHEHYRAQLRYLTLARDLNDDEAAYGHAAAFMKEIWDNADALQRLAEVMLTEVDIPERHFDLAQRAAERACELTADQDVAKLTLAVRAGFVRADYARAMIWADRAMKAGRAAGAEKVEELQKLLERYRLRHGSEEP